MNYNKVEPTIFEFDEAGKWLEAVYLFRKNKNASYSLRSFAKSMDLAHSVFVRLFQKKTAILPETAAQLAGKLALNPQESRYFMEISLEHPNRAVLDQLKVMATSHQVEFDDMSEVLNLKTLALMQLLPKSEELALQVDETARKLSLSHEEILGLLRKLKYHGLIEMKKDGQAKSTGKRIVLESKEARKSLTQMYKAGFQMAAESMDRDLPEERVIGSEFLKFDQGDLPEASALINECLDRLVALSRRSKNKEDVYYCNATLFRLTEKGEKSA